MFLDLAFRPPPPEYRWWHLEQRAPEPITLFTATGENTTGGANVSVPRGDGPDDARAVLVRGFNAWG